MRSHLPPPRVLSSPLLKVHPLDHPTAFMRKPLIKIAPAAWLPGSREILSTTGRKDRPAIDLGAGSLKTLVVFPGDYCMWRRASAGWAGPK